MEQSILSSFSQYWNFFFCSISTQRRWVVFCEFLDEVKKTIRMNAKETNKFVKELGNVNVTLNIILSQGLMHAQGHSFSQNISNSMNIYVLIQKYTYILFNLIGNTEQSETITIILLFVFVFRCFFFSYRVHYMTSKIDYSHCPIAFHAVHSIFISSIEHYFLLTGNLLMASIFKRWRAVNRIPDEKNTWMGHNIKLSERILDFIRKYSIVKLNRWKMKKKVFVRKLGMYFVHFDLQGF